jgi:monovalent cation:H+ antiporter, CPA1 family
VQDSATVQEQLEPILFVIAVGSAVAIAAKRVGIPYNVALVLVGAALVFMHALPITPMDPQVILIVFLPILVFEAALFTDATGLLQAKRPILALAAPGVLVSLLATAAVATWVLALPFGAALLLGALLSITDTVSVLLAFRSVRVPHRLAAIMEGESLFNDGTALVLVSVSTAILARGHLNFEHAARALFVAIVGGMGIGAAVGALGTIVLRKTPDNLTAILASIVLVFGTSLVAERVHASPVIAVVVVGIFVSRAARDVLGPSRVLALHGFWETAGFILNVWIFLLVGMQVHTELLVQEAGTIALALIAMHAGRAVAVYGCFAALRGIGAEIVPTRWQHVMVFGNIKGALSMAAVLALPVSLAYRERLIAVVFGVTFFTLVMQGLPFRRVLLWLGVQVQTQNIGAELARATLISARRGQTELDTLLTEGLLSRKQHAERWAVFQRQIIAAEQTLRAPSAQAEPDHLADLAVLTGQKTALMDAARRGIISSETAEARAAELDTEIVAAALPDKGAH